MKDEVIVLSRNESFTYEYQGSRFRLEPRGWYPRENEYEITGIVTESEKLYLPDTYNGKPITRWDMQEKETPLATVRFLFVPASIADITISNRFFPNLERIEVASDSPKLSTDGQMLFSADGKELLYSLAAGNQERVVVPNTVRKIAKGAFRYAACTDISFENPDVSVAQNAFDSCEWFEKQKDYCVIGNLFYRLKHSVEILEVPEHVRRFHEDAFADGIPKHLMTPIMPPRHAISHLKGGHYYVRSNVFRELTITQTSTALNFKNLADLSGLERIQLPEGHKKYVSVDGVIFSKDRKCLVFYPRGREDGLYEIPEGTVKIAREAFANQTALAEVHMPDTVTMLGMSAFTNCKSLRKVVFSDNIKEIPDSSAYQNGGVFQSCKALHEVVLPSKLQYLGSFAFCYSGVGKVVFNDKLKQIGEYAFWDCQLNEVRLPSSVERLGKGALAGIEAVDAYAGTAKGLVASVNTVPPNVSEKRMNVEWGRCMVHVRHKRGEQTDSFLIPGSLKRAAAYHLDMAWNSDPIDYEEYDACFEEIADPEERLEFAELGILRLKDEEDTPYVAYMKHSALKIASRLLEARKEKEFLAFLERGYLSESAYGKLLKIANTNGLTTCSAYLLKYQNAQGSKKTRRLSL